MSMNFQIDDLVKTTNGLRVSGKVKYIACVAATKAGGKTCNKKQCPHAAKEYIWVDWGVGKDFSYHQNELIGMNSTAIAPETNLSSKDSKTEETPKEFISKLIKEKLENRDNPKAISEAELDFDTYNGFKRSRDGSYGSYRKKSI